LPESEYNYRTADLALMGLQKRINAKRGTLVVLPGAIKNGQQSVSNAPHWAGFGLWLAL
jgi:hypothetical protein